jgi:hypothetical protein
MDKTLRTLIVAVPLLFSIRTQAQWASQTISLQPGWNVVFLEVQPQPQDCDSLFANLPVESVWGWNRKFSPVQFVQDPTTLVPTQPDWLVYLPPTNQVAGARSLYNLESGKCYLIKRPDNSTPITWTIQGQPNMRKTQWVPNSFNLVGFSVDRTNSPSFQAFFSGSPAHTNSPVYRLNSNGTWSQIASLGSTTMRSGEAFWIKCNGASDYQGPLSSSLSQRNGLIYGRSLVEQTLTIQNSSPVAKSIVLTAQASGLPPNGSYPTYAGPVPMSYWKLDTGSKLMAWMPITNTLVLSNLPPGQTMQIRLGVRRPDMAVLPSGGNALYQSLLEVRDLIGSSRLLIPVSAQGLASSIGKAEVATGTYAPKAQALHTGLWIGSASVNAVNQPASVSPDLPTNTASTFQLRLIVHVDGTNQARFLQRILQMYKPGTYMPDANNPSVSVVDQPGRFVLVTDESKVSQITGLTGAALRDDQPVARRFSTAGFGFRDPILMDGSGPFGAGSSAFSCQVVMDYDDPLNPLKHKYHPDHDNLDAGFLQKLPEGQESFTVVRQVQLQFTDADPDNLGLAGWGDTQLGGVYRETIIGLHKRPLYLQGTFRLQLASRVDVLNDGL